MVSTPKYHDHTRHDLVGFTRVMAGFFVLLAGFLFWRAGAEFNNTVQALAIVGGAWLIWGLLHPASTRPLFHGWMWLAYCMNFVMTRVILGVLFFGVVLPTALFLRVAGKDPLGLRVKSESYWKQRDKKPDRTHFDKLFS